MGGSSTDTGKGKHCKLNGIRRKKKERTGRAQGASTMGLKSGRKEGIRTKSDVLQTFAKRNGGTEGGGVFQEKRRNSLKKNTFDLARNWA